MRSVEHMAMLTEARARSKRERKTRTEPLVVELGAEVFSYFAGELRAYESRDAYRRVAAAEKVSEAAAP